jgi:hypothetical protein
MTKARDLSDNALGTKPKVVDAKGDLIAGTGADAADRLPVGSNGDTLVADSAASTGLRWQGSYPAGKNVLINGLLDIWQRSTSVTFSSFAYNAQDRWSNYASTSSTFAQETSVIPTGCRFSCKVTVGASAAAVQSEQVIETLNAAPYAGQTMTFSGHFQSSATPTITFVVYHSSSVDVAVGGSWTAITATSGGSGTAGASSFTRISGVYAIPSTAKSIKVLWFSSSIASAGVLYWGGMQFEAGSVPTTLVRNGATIQGELAACQRYFQRLVNGAEQQAENIGVFQCKGASTGIGSIQFLAPMRAAPTISISSAGHFFRFDSAGASLQALTALSFSQTSPRRTRVDLTWTSGTTAGDATDLIIDNVSGTMDASAEL